jgi:hypothetical protein
LVLRDSSFFGDCPTLGRPFDTAGEAFDELRGIEFDCQTSNAMTVSTTVMETVGNVTVMVLKVGKGNVAEVAEESKIQIISQTVAHSKLCFVFFKLFS